MQKFNTIQIYFFSSENLKLYSYTSQQPYLDIKKVDYTLLAYAKWNYDQKTLTKKVSGVFWKGVMCLMYINNMRYQYVSTEVPMIICYYKI